MQVKDIMEKNLVLFNPEMRLREAAKLLSEKDISGAPVVDGDGKLIGILMVSDIIRELKGKIESMGLAISFTPFDLFDLYSVNMPMESERDIVREVANMKVENVMRKKVYYVRDDDDLDTVIEILGKKDISRVPVVDKDRKVIGIITRSDILRLLANNSLK